MVWEFGILLQIYLLYTIHHFLFGQILKCIFNGSALFCSSPLMFEGALLVVCINFFSVQFEWKQIISISMQSSLSVTTFIDCQYLQMPEFPPVYLTGFFSIDKSIK